RSSSQRSLTGAVASAATGGTKRMTVPARPQSMCPPVNWVGGVIRTVAAAPSELKISTPTPRVRSASSMRFGSGPLRVLGVVAGPWASAARTSARLVMDLDPGTGTVAVTGPDAVGAGQAGWVLVDMALVSHFLGIMGPMCGRYVLYSTPEQLVDAIRRRSG